MAPPRYGIERFLNVRGAASPSFAPDGRSVAFVTGITGVPQVWSVPCGADAGGWPEQLSFHSDRVGFARFSPAEHTLAYGMDSGGDERVQLYLLGSGGAVDEALTADPSVIHNFGGWSRDGRRVAFSSNRRHPAYFDVYAAGLDERTPRLVFQEDGNNYVAAWAPDGRSLVVNRQHAPFINDLLLACLDGTARQLTPSDRPAAWETVQWLPDGSGFYCISDLDRDLPAICFYEAARGCFDVVLEADGEVESLRLSRDGGRLAYAVNAGGYSRISVLHRASGRTVELPAFLRGVAGELSWAPDDRRLAFVFTSGTRNPDVWIWDTDSGEDGAVRQLTFSSRGGLPSSAFVEPELVGFAAHDGLRIPAFWYAPPGVSGPLPTVVHVHGGPESQARPGFNPVIAYLVNQGYGVLAANVRGSTGYGKRYRSLDDLELRMDSVADLKSAAGWLAESGRSDRDRIAVMGGSYGGFMTLAALTTYPETWAAGVDIVGIANWVTFMQHTGPWRRKLREAEYGSLEHHRDLLERISPLHRADQIRAPLLVIHGANDPRVPIGEAEQIVAAVRAREVPCEYLRYEDEGHGLVKLSNRIPAYTAIAAFLDRHLRA